MAELDRLFRSSQTDLFEALRQIRNNLERTSSTLNSHTLGTSRLSAALQPTRTAGSGRGYLASERQSSSLLASSGGDRDWQRAVRYGERSPANPGRTGATRARYAHDGVIYLVEDGRRLVDSWPQANQRSDSHTVLIVDHSGSMRKDDVSGYTSRTHAVYECLARDFMQPQLAKALGSMGEAWVSLIEMSDDAQVVFERQALSAGLVDEVRDRAHNRARSHGNYLPALDQAHELLRSDAKRGTRSLLIFLSDGAPSDHNAMECSHGVRVWESEQSGVVRFDGRPQLRSCFSGGNACRKNVQTKVRSQCLERVRALGELVGKEKLVVGTVAFGPVREDFTILEQMAKQVPRGHFQKLSIQASALRTAFTSLTSDLTALRSEGVGGLTVRDKEVQDDGGYGSEVHPLGYEWQTFLTGVRKYRFDMQQRELVAIGLQSGSTGMAYYRSPFASGAERLVYRCTEVDGSRRRKGLKLVCKEARHEELMGLKFHKKCCRVQTRAAEIAEAFNKRHGGPASWDVSFVNCYVYEFPSSCGRQESAWVLAEAELEGLWRKWNNNAGGVINDSGAALGAIAEGDEEDSEEDTERVADRSKSAIEEIPQCFSHFSHVHTGGRELVCDLQGVWNEVDGFTLTDPVVHYASESGTRNHNGATDKGHSGIAKFFETHKCGELCRKLGLSSQAPGVLRECTVCLVEKRAGAFRPCGHNVACKDCATRILRISPKCPLCRQRVTGFQDGMYSDTFVGF
eukprot:TRINITY_DN49187_c0_g1_i1.p1 TRINITY_DN49187_c0_g1~~TRINITY_DN49187_c0_g1_i1.p1  ORF type:complete len:759 (+),score=107.99 TRINITY_DN49187_c0_g1_i1:52-2277(+)